MSEKVIEVPQGTVAPYVPDVSSPWCVRPGYGRVLYTAYENYVKSGFNLAAIYPDLKVEARTPKDMSRIHKDFVTWFDGDTPVVDVNGTLMQDEPPSSFIGEAKTITYPQITKVLNDLVHNSPCPRIVLRIRSYGGNASGAIQCMDSIARLAKQKPIIGYINNYACSGGYFLASQCTEIAAAKGSDIGNIGVFMVLVDDSKRLEAEGLKLIVVSSSDLKGAGADGEVSEELVEDTQRMIDEYNVQLTSRVQTARELSDKELTAVADGRIHQPEQALKMKLINQISNWDEFVNIATESDSYQFNSNTGKTKPPNKGDSQMANPTNLDEALAEIQRLNEANAQITADKETMQSEFSERLKTVEGSVTQAQEQQTEFQTQIDNLTAERDQAVVDKEAAEKKASSLEKAETDREVTYRKAFCKEWVKRQIAEGRLLPRDAKKLHAFLTALTPHTGNVTIKYTDGDDTEHKLEGELYDVAVRAIEGCIGTPEMSHLNEQSLSTISAEEQAKLDAGTNPLEDKLKERGIETDDDQPLANSVPIGANGSDKTGLTDTGKLLAEAEWE